VAAGFIDNYTLPRTPGRVYGFIIPPAGRRKSMHLGAVLHRTAPGDSTLGERRSHPSAQPELQSGSGFRCDPRVQLDDPVSRALCRRTGTGEFSLEAVHLR
jgi:hypothetical protein